MYVQERVDQARVTECEKGDNQNIAETSPFLQLLLSIRL